MHRLPRLLLPVGIGAALLLAAPVPASAHSLTQQTDLPIPEWLFGWAVAIVLVASFAALAVLWPTPKLERTRDWRPLPGGLGVVLGSRAAEIVCGAIGIALLAVLIVAGFDGSPVPQQNLLPTAVMVLFWVGLAFASVLLGDVFRAFNPWRAIARAIGWAFERVAGRPLPVAAYPARIGRWPAALTLLLFTWIELVSHVVDHPSQLATACLVYSAVAIAACLRYGPDAWCDRGEGFSVYFGLFARMAAVETRERVVGLRAPLSGLPRLDHAVPGTVGVLAVMIGTVTFDGFSQGDLWGDVTRELTGWWIDLGLGASAATKVSGTIGLLIGVGIVAGFYELGIHGARSVGGKLDADRLRAGFVHTLVPIALAYVAAHYLTYLLYQGQAIRYLAADPFGRGWNLLGGADSAIDYGLLSQNAAWYLQVGCVLVGHVAALILAHDRALVLYRKPQLAVRSQYWMLGVMVGFTTLALWLLAQATA